MEGYIQDREARLKSINEQLAQRGLKPLPALGDVREGEMEILGIIAFADDFKKWLTDVHFATRLPTNGTESKFIVRFNANGEKSDGAVMVILMNQKVVIVKQWRTTMGRYTYEVPRGYGEKMDKARIQGMLGTLKIGDLPLGTLARELGEEVMRTAEIRSITHLGNIAQNTGTDSVIPSYFLVQVQVDADGLEKRLHGSSEEEKIKVYLWDSATVDREMGRKLADNHTITAISIARQYINSLPKLA